MLVLLERFLAGGSIFAEIGLGVVDGAEEIQVGETVGPLGQDVPARIPEGECAGG